ncbi:MAG: Hsp20/alpha crystallin family protein [Anaerolineae bacterium]|nr:Hsp20/alpha crystallin family protein [Anaerolineae bacterium]
MTNLAPHGRNLHQEVYRILDSMGEALRRRHDWDSQFPEMLDIPSLAVNVAESQDKITVTTTVPGVEEDDIDISVNDGTLTISAEIREEQEEVEQDWLIRELAVGKLTRKIRLPAEVNLEASEAELDDGVLTITLPKEEPDPLRKIAVKAKELLPGRDNES